LAMEEIAHRLDRRRHDRQMDETARGGPERVMVALSSRSPNSAALLRKTARMADRLGAPWYAVYIQTPRENFDRIDAATQRLVSNTQELARQLGGTAFTFKGSQVAAAIATFAKEYSITHIVLGRSQRPWYYRLFGPSVLDGLLHSVRGVDVIIVDCV
jgi:two-component system sensor histidine kinase KdpD